MKNLVFRFQSSVISLPSIKKFNSASIVLFCFLFGFNTVFAQFKIPKKPDFQTSVYDYINLFSEAEKSALEEKLIKYSDTTSTQIVIATINSTEGENIDYLGTKWAHDWGIGQAKEDNGIFILLAKGDRKITIKTGYGVEHLLTDAMSKRIIENDIIPYFKQDDYYGGLNRGSDAIFEVLTGEYQGTRKQTESKEFPVGVIVFLIFIFIMIIISISKNNRGGSGRNRGNRSDAMDIFEAIILSNMGRSSGGFVGKSSGGGFSGGGGFGGGFGGGGFGGGGASGGW